MFILSSAYAFYFDKFKIVSFGKEFIFDHKILDSFLMKTLTLSQTSPDFYVSALESFDNNSGKRRDCS